MPKNVDVSTYLPHGSTSDTLFISFIIIYFYLYNVKYMVRLLEYLVIFKRSRKKRGAVRPARFLISKNNSLLVLNYFIVQNLLYHPLCVDDSDRSISSVGAPVIYHDICRRTWLVVCINPISRIDPCQGLVVDHQQVLGVVVLGRTGEVEGTRNDGLAVDQHHLVVRTMPRPA